MTNNLKDKLDNIPIPDDLDKRIELGFEDARKYNKRRNRFKKSIIGIAASLVIVIGTMSLIGFDKVEAAIKQVMQYVPGYNVVVESDEGNVLVLKDNVSYKEDGIYVDIVAASKLDENFNISIKSNYEPIENTDVILKDEANNIFTTSAWSWAGGGDFWEGEYYFEVEDGYNNYSLLLDDIEIPFVLAKGTEVEDFLQLGNHASDRGIDIVAIKKPLKDRLMISLLHQAEDKTLTDYPFEQSLSGIRWDNQPLQIEKNMYIIDREGNKTYPTIPSSFGGLMSDFYFDTEDKDGLKLVLPYMKTLDYNAKSHKIKIKTPKDGASHEINKVVSLGDFEISVFDVRRQDEEVLIRLESNSLEDEKLDQVRIGGINGYGLGPNEITGHMEISINVEDVGRSFSIFFENPETLLLGDWIIDLD